MMSKSGCGDHHWICLLLELICRVLEVSSNISKYLVQGDLVGGNKHLMALDATYMAVSIATSFTETNQVVTF